MKDSKYDIKYCPICQTELMDALECRSSVYVYINCPNYCYYYLYNLSLKRGKRSVHEVGIFGKCFNLIGDYKVFVEREIDAEIKYWTENDRYVMKLLEES